jgi:hypothetical protein
MDCDCHICSEQSWWDWLEGEPGLGRTIGFLILTLSVSVVLCL